MICGECGNVTAPGVGFPNHVYCKRFLLHMEKRKDASRCRDFIPKPITNSDRFRAMTDDSIADFLNGVETEGRAYGPKGKAAWLEWLKQEVNVE